MGISGYVWDVCRCVWVCAGVRGCARVYLGVRGCAQVCAGVLGCVRVCMGVRWVCAGVHGCAGCAQLCAGVHRFAQEYACMCGMNFQNFFWRIESLYQRTLIRIQYKFLCQILMIFGFSLNVWSRAIFDNLVAQPGAFGKNMSAPGPKSSYLHLCYSVGPIPNKFSRVCWNSSISILQMN